MRIYPFHIVVTAISAFLTMVLMSNITSTPQEYHKHENRPVVIEINEIRQANTKVNKTEVECLASAMWHEAGNQPEEGKIAVAEVILSRKASKQYPKDACAVITQPNQFSFVRKGHVPPVPHKHKKTLTSLAQKVVTGQVHSSVKGAISFHATYVRPKWNLPVVGRIGTHIFYGKNS